MKSAPHGRSGARSIFVTSSSRVRQRRGSAASAATACVFKLAQTHVLGKCSEGQAAQGGRSERSSCVWFEWAQSHVLGECSK